MTSELRDEVSDPMVAAFSTNNTSRPAKDKALAMAIPITPAPMTQTSVWKEGLMEVLSNMFPLLAKNQFRTKCYTAAGMSNFESMLPPKKSLLICVWPVRSIHCGLFVTVRDQNFYI